MTVIDNVIIAMAMSSVPKAQSKARAAISALSLVAIAFVGVLTIEGFGIYLVIKKIKSSSKKPPKVVSKGTTSSKSGKKLNAK